MLKLMLRQQMVPLTILVVLALIELSSLLVHRHMKQSYRQFSTVRYERSISRVDAAIDSISHTMAREGLTADFEEILRHNGSIEGNEVFGSLEEPEEVKDTSLTLTGVIWHSKKPLAFLNGVLVGVGDRVGDAEVRQIKPSSMVVRLVDGEERTLTLEEPDVR